MSSRKRPRNIPPPPRPSKATQRRPPPPPPPSPPNFPKRRRGLARNFTGIVNVNKPPVLFNYQGEAYSTAEPVNLNRRVGPAYSHRLTTYNKEKGWPTMGLTNENQRGDPEYAGYFAYRNSILPRFAATRYAGSPPPSPERPPGLPLPQRTLELSPGHDGGKRRATRRRRRRN